MPNISTKPQSSTSQSIISQASSSDVLGYAALPYTIEVETGVILYDQKKMIGA